MLAPRSIPRLPPALPQVVDIVVGNALELMIQSVESLREQVRRLSLR